MDEEQASEKEEQSGPEPGRARHLIVGLGASAGGLEALEAFFDNVPEDSGIGFVVVTHLAPGRVSLLPELLARHSRVPVKQIAAATRVEPDHVYLAPAGSNLGILNGVLHLMDPVESGPRPLPIDYFFRSLAQDQKDWSVGVVLSGTGTDGTLGLKEIKGASGLAMAQDEASARYPGMPHSAIATTQVDYILAPPEMPKQLVAYARRAGLRGGGRIENDGEAPEVLHRIFLLLRSRTGHDFSYYKGTTIRRRIERRMNVHQIETSKDYLRFLQTNPAEVERLFKELLIGVTSFFRDAEAFDLLAGSTLPDLLAGKPDDYTFRVWVAGCSTGEEAYSIAILLKEISEGLKRRMTAQVFATDLDTDAIDVARAAVYPDSIAADVSPRRLERYFVRENGYFRVKKDVREMLVFAQQNVITDPPFTKVDLLSCRNLLIYLDGKIQQRLIPMFHYALRPPGVLFLGSSETIGTFGNLFEPVDKKWKIFRRKDAAVSGYVADIGPAASAQDVVARDLPPVPASRKALEAGVAQLAERALLQQLVPPSVIIHERGEIVHIHGRTGLFLEPAPGPQGQANIYNMAREGLQLELAVAIRHASTADGEVVHKGVLVKSNGDGVVINLRVRKLASPESLRGLYLVAFERAPEPASTDGQEAAPVGSPTGLAQRISDLERELQHAKEVHQGTVEELETANEELKSTNEELQSTNEELQSANEELETSKEEMQSLNEELQTVNSELQGKVEELSRANDDMKNLLNATDIATVFLDNDLNIMRYTDQAKRVIRLIPSDVGRQVGDLVSRLRYDQLVEDAREVLRTLVFKEAEVQGEDGIWYLMRMLPYRTTENVIDGLVITFVDVSKARKLQEQTSRMLEALRNSPTTVIGQNRELRYEWAFGNVFGRDSEETVGKSDRELVGEEEARALVDLKRRVLEEGKHVRQRVPVTYGGIRRAYDVYLEAQRNARNEVVGLTGVVTELEERGRS
jgi:two-component system CheB/CheR fusion protein